MDKQTARKEIKKWLLDEGLAKNRNPLGQFFVFQPAREKLEAKWEEVRDTLTAANFAEDYSFYRLFPSNGKTVIIQIPLAGLPLLAGIERELEDAQRQWEREGKKLLFRKSAEEVAKRAQIFIAAGFRDALDIRHISGDVSGHALFLDTQEARIFALTEYPPAQYSY